MQDIGDAALLAINNGKDSKIIEMRTIPTLFFVDTQALKPLADATAPNNKV